MPDQWIAVLLESCLMREATDAASSLTAMHGHFRSHLMHEHEADMQIREQLVLTKACACIQAELEAMRSCGLDSPSSLISSPSGFSSTPHDPSAIAAVYPSGSQPTSPFHPVMRAGTSCHHTCQGPALLLSSFTLHPARILSLIQQQPSCISNSRLHKTACFRREMLVHCCVGKRALIHLQHLFHGEPLGSCSELRQKLVQMTCHFLAGLETA